jgi:nucleoside permease NupC
MNAYKSDTPRAAFVLAALAMTVLTVVASILVPANIDSGASRSSVLAQSSVPAAAAGVSASDFTRGDALVVNVTATRAKPVASTSAHCPDSA